MNKTGTTSLLEFMKIHGYACGDQAEGEMLIKDLNVNDWSGFVDYCDSAEFFQDLPFSGTKSLSVLAENYPDAKYILTIRNSAEIWYNSLVAFHQSVFGNPLNKDTLKESPYRYHGFAWHANRFLYTSPESDPYQRASLINDYEEHIRIAKRTFDTDTSLLVLNLSEPNSVNRLSTFLGIKSKVATMPWLNKRVHT